MCARRGVRTDAARRDHAAARRRAVPERHSVAERAPDAASQRGPGGDTASNPDADPRTNGTPEPKPYAINLATTADFVPQYTFEWCVGASIMMTRSILTDSRNESRASQRRLWELARDLTVGSPYGGANPAGWAAALDELGLGPYRLVSLPTFDAAVDRAALALAETRRPVGLVMWAGRHAWVMTGFKATADPRKRRGRTGHARARDGPALPARFPVGSSPAPNRLITLQDARAPVRQARPAATTTSAWTPAGCWSSRSTEDAPRRRGGGQKSRRPSKCSRTPGRTSSYSAIRWPPGVRERRARSGRDLERPMRRPAAPCELRDGHRKVGDAVDEDRPLALDVVGEEHGRGPELSSTIATRIPPSSIANTRRPPSTVVKSATSAATSRLGVYRKSRLSMPIGPAMSTAYAPRHEEGAAPGEGTTPSRSGAAEQVGIRSLREASAVRAALAVHLRRRVRDAGVQDPAVLGRDDEAVGLREADVREREGA